MRKMFLLGAATLSLALALTATAADKAPKTVLEGLNNPCGLAVQPETGLLFVSDSGAGRIVCVKDGKAVDVVTDFPSDVYGKGPKYAIGPLGLAFIDQNTLVVGGGGQKDGDELLRVYDLSGGKPLKADQMKASYKLPARGDEVKGEGNFYDVVFGLGGVYVSCNGDDTKGWVARLPIKKDGSMGKFTRFLATKEAVEVDAPVGLEIVKRHLIVGQMGEISIPGDSLLTVYDRKKKMVANLETELHDITGLAASPKSKKKIRLLVTDFAWNDTTQGGLFTAMVELGDEPKVTVKKVASLDKPTALVFGNDGELYVTVIGEGEKGGKVVCFAPGL